jgi:MinD-like ATPase involved in chromosome partitioning or flagellar assembly
VDLPTYTSIWRIEKRLYKLYDFRLPMPLPIGQITVFAAIAVPYVVLLTVLGLPFNHTLVWLYVLPPGAATWLITRPVLESKRLPELIKSQLRYLAEPRVWCRMAPLGEWDVIVVTGRVWRLTEPGLMKARRMKASRAKASRARESAVRTGSAKPSPAKPAPPPRSATIRPPARPGVQPRPASLASPAEPRRPVRSPTAPPTRPAVPPPAPVRAAQASRSAVTVVTARQGAQAPPTLESALAGPAARRNDTRAGRVTVVPGGHRPGKPDQLQRDRARARLALDGPHRVVVLGCTVGAGQTAVTLLTGEVLASLRSDSVAVLDLNPGSESLARQAQQRPAQQRPALGQAASPGPSRLTVITADSDPNRAVEAFEQATAKHQIVLADPSTVTVTRLLAIADQLVLVAPASAAASQAISMTFEWLDAHGQAGLASDAIMVMNGVSHRSMPHVEQAERVCVGRCRAIVRLPWADQLKTDMVKRTSSTPSGSPAGQQSAGPLSPATVGACTALGGVLVAALADQADTGRVPR